MSDAIVQITEEVASVIIEEEGEVAVEIALPAQIATATVSIPGPSGLRGKSAYEVAVENGFVGTEEEWLDSLAIAGPPGPAGADLFFEYIQNNPSDTWGPVVHNLGKFPSVSAIDSAGTAMDVGVSYIDADTLTAYTSTPQSGKLYLN